MEQFLSDAKRLVHRLHSHDTSVDVLISEATELQNKLIAMRHYRDEVGKMNEIANHRPRSTLILGSQLENQRIQTLESENRELSVSLAEHQSALEMIMNKYREQVLSMMKSNQDCDVISNASQVGSENPNKMKEQITEMAYVMKQSVLLDDQSAMKELSLFRQLQIENENLRELLLISGQTPPASSNTRKLEEIYESYNVNFKSALDNNQMDGKKDFDIFQNKDSGIYENGDIHSPLDIKRFRVYDSLENLYQKVNNEDNTDHKDFDELLTEDEPSENCFRAIITDIKPLVETNDNDDRIEQPDIGDIFSEPSVNHNVSDGNKLMKHEFNSHVEDRFTSVDHAQDIEDGKMDDDFAGHEDNDNNIELELENELNSLQMLDSILQDHGVDDSDNSIVENHEINDHSYDSLPTTEEKSEKYLMKNNDDVANDSSILDHDSSSDITIVESNSNDFTINEIKDLKLVNGISDDSDCESEKTVINESDHDEDDDINDVMACFDSVLDEELNF